MSSSLKRMAVAAAFLAGATGLVACGDDSGSSASTQASTATTTGGATTAGGSGSTAAGGGGVNPSAFTSDFSAMAALKSVASSGKGMVGVLLPDTASSARYVSFDAPYLAKAFEAAGLTSSQYKIDNAQGSASRMASQADADITQGASVLLVDPLDS